MPSLSYRSASCALSETFWEPGPTGEHTNCTVLHYTLAGNVTVKKCTQDFPNTTPWMTSKVRLLIRDHNTTYRSGDKSLYCSARDLRRDIKAAKDSYKKKIEGHLNNNHRGCQRIQHITNYRGSNATTVNAGRGSQQLQQPPQPIAAPL